MDEVVCSSPDQSTAINSSNQPGSRRLTVEGRFPYRVDGRVVERQQLGRPPGALLPQAGGVDVTRGGAGRQPDGGHRAPGAILLVHVESGGLEHVLNRTLGLLSQDGGGTSFFRAATNVGERHVPGTRCPDWRSFRSPKSRSSAIPGHHMGDRYPRDHRSALDV